MTYKELISFNPRTRKGATLVEKWARSGLTVSIHAPVRVRPLPFLCFYAILMFQSTHP